MTGWNQYVGELAGGEFPLERYLGGGETGAVFLTRFAAETAAVKLVRAGEAQAAGLLKRWNDASALRHPHLLRILGAGTCELAGMPLAYLVTEYAEENLAEVLRDRPLTPDETREMLVPVAGALAYLHGRGLAHGNLKPSEILAVQDTVKITSETVSAGDAAADLRALGIVLVQALTQQTPDTAQGGRGPMVAGLPPPFREIAQQCLQDDPRRIRWSAESIVARLRASGEAAGTLPAGKAGPRRYLAAAVVVAGAAIAGALLMRRAEVPAAPPAETARPVADAAPPEEAAPPRQEAAPKPSLLPPDGAPVAPRRPTASGDEITHRVLPDIPAKARNTIRGKATVVVRVAVDPAGNVTEAALESTVSSYFGRLALEAARQWRFAAVEGGGPRSWILRFQITRTATTVVPRRTGR